ncbi:hypothetical protein HK104_009911 [Borealophlyctis nickersoniae]|nr:hypothetical protein HK104_009911 [Borealophlyctis nickersoniae]
MAKGLRSKSKRSSKAIRRTNIHGPVEEARLHRLAQKQADAAGTVVSPSAMEVETATATSGGDQEERGRAPAAAAVVEEADGDEDVKMEVDSGEAAGTNNTTTPGMTKLEKERLFMTGNAFKKRQKARAKSVKRSKAGKVAKPPRNTKGTKAR